MGTEAAPTQTVRYSTGKEDVGAAKDFRWEHPVPVTPFWNDLPFTAARNFLQSFTPDEVARLDIDQNSTADKSTKIHHLYDLLVRKAADQELAAAADDKQYHDIDYEGWSTLWLAIFTMQKELGQLDSAEKTIRKLDEFRRNKENLSHQHSLAGLLLETGRYAEAEEMAKPVRDWLDGRLGKNSPQALGSRRQIATAVWKQGPARRDEAKELLEEIRGLVGTLKGTQFEVYEDDESEALEELIVQLHQEDTN